MMILNKKDIQSIVHKFLTNKLVGTINRPLEIQTVQEYMIELVGQLVGICEEELIDPICKSTGVCQETEGFKGTEHEGVDMCTDGCVHYVPKKKQSLPEWCRQTESCGKSLTGKCICPKPYKYDLIGDFSKEGQDHFSKQYNEKDLKSVFEAGEKYCSTEGKVYKRSEDFDTFINQLNKNRIVK